jgi:hypothetical protein
MNLVLNLDEKLQGLLQPAGNEESQLTIDEILDSHDFEAADKILKKYK